MWQTETTHTHTHTHTHKSSLWPSCWCSVCFAIDSRFVHYLCLVCVSPAIPGSRTCDVRYNTDTVSSWTLTVNCTVSGAYSFLNRYNCQLVQVGPDVSTVKCWTIVYRRIMLVHRYSREQREREKERKREREKESSGLFRVIYHLVLACYY